LVAGSQIGCGIADSDHRFARERVVGESTLHPTSVDVVVTTGTVVPVTCSERDGSSRRCGHARQSSIASKGYIGRGILVHGNE
jgi:hypothetical protein